MINYRYTKAPSLSRKYILREKSIRFHRTCGTVDENDRMTLTVGSEIMTLQWKELYRPTDKQPKRFAFNSNKNKVLWQPEMMHNSQTHTAPMAALKRRPLKLLLEMLDIFW